MALVGRVLGKGHAGLGVARAPPRSFGLFRLLQRDYGIDINNLFGLCMLFPCVNSFLEDILL